MRIFLLHSTTHAMQKSKIKIENTRHFVKNVFFFQKNVKEESASHPPPSDSFQRRCPKFWEKYVNIQSPLFVLSSGSFGLISTIQHRPESAKNILKFDKARCLHNYTSFWINLVRYLNIIFCACFMSRVVSARLQREWKFWVLKFKTVSKFQNFITT